MKYFKSRPKNERQVIRQRWSRGQANSSPTSSKIDSPTAAPETAPTLPPIDTAAATEPTPPTRINGQVSQVTIQGVRRG